jgi:hypothetical protein
LSRSGSRRGPRGPGSRRENARGHRTSNTGTQSEGAASVGVVLRSSISLRPVAVVFGLGVGPVGSWSSGRGEVAGRDDGISSVFLAGPSGLGWLLRGSCHCGGLGGLAGWDLGFLLRQGLCPPRPPPSIPGPAVGPWRWSRRTSGVPVGRRV